MFLLCVLLLYELNVNEYDNIIIHIDIHKGGGGGGQKVREYEKFVTIETIHTDRMTCIIQTKLFPHAKVVSHLIQPYTYISPVLDW